MIWNTQTHKPTHRHTHTYTRRCCCETNTHSRSRTCLGNATSSQQLMDVAKSKEERNTKKKNEHSRRRRPSFWVHNREKGRKNQEREFFGIKQCFLYQQRKKGAGLRNRASRRLEARRPPVSDPPLTFLSSPLSLFFFFHSSHLLYLPPLPLQKRVTLGHYFHFLNPTFTLLATWLTVALEWLTGGACTSVFKSVLNHSFGMCWALIDLVIQIKKLMIESFE